MRWTLVIDMNEIDYGLKEINEVDYGMTKNKMRCDQ